MKMTMKIGVAALVMAALGAPVFAAEVSDIALIHCQQTVPRWNASPTVYTLRTGLPSYQCLQDYYGSQASFNVSAFGVRYGMASREEYDVWALMVSAYSQSDAMRKVQQDGTGYAFGGQDSSDPISLGAVRRNYQKVMGGFSNVLEGANPWKKTVLQAESERVAATQCGKEQEMTISAIKDAGMRRAATAEYQKRCGPEAQAAAEKQRAEAAAAKEARAPRIIELSELEPTSTSNPSVGDLHKWLQNPELTGVVIGNPSAPQGVIAVDVSSRRSKQALRQVWPAIRDGLVSQKIIFVAAVDQDSPTGAFFLTGDTPTLWVRDWLLAGDDATPAGAVKARIAADNKAVVAGAKDKGAAPVLAQYQSPSAERQAAAKAAVERNTQIALKSGIAAVPFGYGMTDGKPYVMERLQEMPPRYSLLMGTDPATLMYEPAIYAKFQSIRGFRGQKLDLKTLTRKLCATEGSADCWFAYEPKKGWW